MKIRYHHFLRADANTFVLLQRGQFFQPIFSTSKTRTEFLQSRKFNTFAT